MCEKILVRGGRETYLTALGPFSLLEGLNTFHKICRILVMILHNRDTLALPYVSRSLPVTIE